MYYLVINCGSSSIKVSLFGKNRRIDAHFQNLNSGTPHLEISGAKSKRFAKKIPFQKALEHIFNSLLLKSKPIYGIGHRFVHGGKIFRCPTKIDAKSVRLLEKLLDLAPLHNKNCLLGIQTARSYFGSKIPQIAVFDTAFHATMPEHAASYALAKKYTDTYDIKRYGFHGISHNFLWDLYSKHVSKNHKVITLHLGAGCSMTAIDKGRSIDTSMGFTPLEGLVMATRCGDIDAQVIEYLVQHENTSVSKILHTLNHESGLLGVSGVSANMKEVLQAKTPSSRLAVDLFCYRIHKYLGAYIAALQGVDAILFSGGIGENSPEIRQRIIQGLNWYGAKISSKKNEGCKGQKSASIKKISTRSSKVSIYVIATDENLAISLELQNTLNL